MESRDALGNRLKRDPFTGIMWAPGMPSSGLAYAHEARLWRKERERAMAFASELAAARKQRERAAAKPVFDIDAPFGMNTDPRTGQFVHPEHRRPGPKSINYFQYHLSQPRSAEERSRLFRMRGSNNWYGVVRPVVPRSCSGSMLGYVPSADQNLHRGFHSGRTAGRAFDDDTGGHARSYEEPPPRQGRDTGLRERELRRAASVPTFVPPPATAWGSAEACPATPRGPIMSIDRTGMVYPVYTGRKEELAQKVGSAHWSTVASPATPRASTVSRPATPRGSTVASPATPRGSTMASPATPRGSTMASPATPRGSTVASPATPRGSTVGWGPPPPRLPPPPQTCETYFV